MLLRQGVAPTPPWMAVVDERGGEIVLGDATVVVPPGAIEGQPAIMRLSSERIIQFDQTARNITYYRLEGIPYSLNKPIDVVLYNPKWWEEGWEAPLLCFAEEGYSPSRGQVGRHYSFEEPDAYVNNRFHFQIPPWMMRHERLLARISSKATTAGTFLPSVDTCAIQHQIFPWPSRRPLTRRLWSNLPTIWSRPMPVSGSQTWGSVMGPGPIGRYRWCSRILG